MEIVKYEMRDLREIYDALHVSEILYLAVNDEKYPIIFSMLFGCEMVDDTIILYFYDDKKNDKTEIISKHPDVSIRTEVVYEYYEYPETAMSCSYESVTGTGTCVLCNEEFHHAMDLILTHYGFEGSLVNDDLAEKKNIFKITLNHVTGKRHVKTPQF